MSTMPRGGEHRDENDPRPDETSAGDMALKLKRMGANWRSFEETDIQQELILAINERTRLSGKATDELKQLSPCSRKLIDDLPDENITSLLNHYQQNHPALFDTMVQLSLVHVRINQLEEYMFWCDPMDVR